MSQGWNIAIFGASGAVGGALIELLAERKFPVTHWHLLDRNENAGALRRIAGKTHTTQDVATFDWSKAQIAFFVAGTQASAQYIKTAVGAGCLVIDNSGLFSGMPDVPVIVPQVNDAALAAYRNHNIVALAGSLTCQLLLALQPLMALSPLAQVQVTSLLAASAHGTAAVHALAGQSASLLNGQPIGDPAPFSGQLAFNTLPLLPDETGSVAQERRLVDEVRKVLLLPDLPLSVSCLQVPVFYGQGQMVSVALQQTISLQQAQQAWTDCATIFLPKAPEFPDPVSQASNTEQLSIGCLRENYGQPEQLQFWTVADNVHFTGALMAVQVAERLVQEHLR